MNEQEKQTIHSKISILQKSTIISPPLFIILGVCLSYYLNEKIWLVLIPIGILDYFVMKFMVKILYKQLEKENGES